MRLLLLAALGAAAAIGGLLAWLNLRDLDDEDTGPYRILGI